MKFERDIGCCVPTPARRNRLVLVTWRQNLGQSDFGSYN